MFLVKSIKLPTDNFNVMKYIKFAAHAEQLKYRGTRSATSKLIYNLSHYNTARNFYFNSKALAYHL